MLTCVMCYATTVCSTRVVRVGLCVSSFGSGFLPMYESREVSTSDRQYMESGYHKGSNFHKTGASPFTSVQNQNIDSFGSRFHT